MSPYPFTPGLPSAAAGAQRTRVSRNHQRRPPHHRNHLPDRARHLSRKPTASLHQLQRNPVVYRRRIHQRPKPRPAQLRSHRPKPPRRPLLRPPPSRGSHHHKPPSLHTQPIAPHLRPLIHQQPHLRRPQHLTHSPTQRLTHKQKSHAPNSSPPAACTTNQPPALEDSPPQQKPPPPPSFPPPPTSTTPAYPHKRSNSHPTATPAEAHEPHPESSPKNPSLPLLRRNPLPCIDTRHIPARSLQQLLLPWLNRPRNKPLRVRLPQRRYCRHRMQHIPIAPIRTISTRRGRRHRFPTAESVPQATIFSRA